MLTTRSLADVAQALGVSKQAVSKAANSPHLDRPPLVTWLASTRPATEADAPPGASAGGRLALR